MKKNSPEMRSLKTFKKGKSGFVYKTQYYCVLVNYQRFAYVKIEIIRFGKAFMKRFGDLNE